MYLAENLEETRPAYNNSMLEESISANAYSSLSEGRGQAVCPCSNV